MPRKKTPPPAPPTPVAEKPPPDGVYRGHRGPDGAGVVVIDGGHERSLPLRLDLRRHSPTGFGWGYAGSGPAQLALALAADALGDDARARRVYQRLKTAVVAGLPADGWELTASQVRATVAALEQGRSVDSVVAPEPRTPPAEPTARPADSESRVHPPEGEPRVEPDTSPVLPDRADDRTPPHRSHVESVRPNGPRVPNPFGHKQDALAGVRLLEDRRFKQVQLKFAEKPPEEVRRLVSEAGFRWLQEEQVWAKQIDQEKGWQTRAETEDLFDRVTAMIRVAKGLTREHT